MTAPAATAMGIQFMCLFFLLEYVSVQARPEITPFNIEGFSKLEYGEPKFIPDISDILIWSLPRPTRKAFPRDFTVCNHLLTLQRNEVFTVTIPPVSTCLLYIKAPDGYMLEQRSSPVVKFVGCNKEQLRIKDQRTIVYCNGSLPLLFHGGMDHIAIMYQSFSPGHRPPITFAVTVKAKSSTLPGSTQDPASGKTETVWQDPVYNAHENRRSELLEIARQNSSLQVCPETCGAAKHDGLYRFTTGTAAIEGEVPYVVRVTVDYEAHNRERGVTKITCGGSILNSRHVLTAAHCLQDKRQQSGKFVGGKVYSADINVRKQDPHEQEISFKEFVVHPDYLSRVMPEHYYTLHDVAIIKLPKDLLFGPYVGTICIAPPINFVHQVATVSGYAPLEKVQENWHLWKAGVIISNYYETCRKLDTIVDPTRTYRKACSFGLQKYSCNEDIGGPLAVDEGNVWFQVGVVSEGFCGNPDEPHFYANVTTVVDFIKHNVHSGRCR